MTEERIPASTLEKYYRVSAPREERGTGPKNEIRISQKSDRIGQYIMYAINLFLKDNEDSVIIKATGNAVVKCVLIAEILRHRIPDLHQINKISSTEVKDTWRPKEEGLDEITTTKVLAVLEIKLTLKPTSQELNDASYQKPLPADQVEKVDLNNPYPARESGFSRGGDREDRPFGRGGRGGRGSRGGRGGRGGFRGGFRRGNARRGGDFRDRDEDVYRQPAPKDFEPENFRRGAPQQRRGGDRRDEDYDRRPQRGGYRGGDRRDFRDDRREFREDRRDYREDRRDYREDRRDNREERDDRRDNRDNRDDRRDDYDRDRGFGGRGGFRGGRGGFRGSRGGFGGGRGGFRGGRF